MAGADISSSSGLNGANIASLLSLITDKKTTGSTTSTTSSNISADGISALVSQILGSSQGLAAVSSGQKSAGLYNSSTNQQLTNDLISRTAGELAVRQVGTTTTQSQSGRQVAPIGSNQLISAGLGLLGTTLLGPTVKAAAQKTGISNVGNTIRDKLGLGPAASDDLGTTVSGGGLSSTPAISSFDDLFGGVGSNTPLSGGSVTASPLAVSSPADSTNGDVGDGSGGFSAADAAAGIGGAALGTAALAGAGDAAAIGAGSVTVGALTAGAGEAAGGAGLAEALPVALAAWIICTELRKQGRLPREYYVPGLRVFNSYPEERKNGYYIWAIPTVRHLQKRPESTFSKFVCWVFNKRAEFLAARAGVRGAKKTFWGFLFTHGLYYGCYGISFIAPRISTQETLGEIYGN